MKVNMRLKTKKTSLKKGLILYHGTQLKFEESGIEVPLWLSESIAVARRFIEWHEEYESEDNSPRILVYEVVRNISVLNIEDDDAFAHLLEIFGVGSPCELAQKMIGNFNGWIIPQNYSEGSDILICNKEDILLKQIINC